MNAKDTTRQYSQIGYTYLTSGLIFWDARAARGMSNILCNFSGSCGILKKDTSPEIS